MEIRRNKVAPIKELAANITQNSKHKITKNIEK